MPVDGNRVEGTTLEGTPVWPLDARLYVSLTAPEYTGSLYVGTSPSRVAFKKEAPLHRIGTITAPTALYGIAHRAGNKVTKASSLSRSRRKVERVKIFQPTFIFVNLSNRRFYFELINFLWLINIILLLLLVSDW